MEANWRWFGPSDTISLAEVRQTGVRGIVSALHGIPPGEVWSPEAIAERQAIIAGPPDTPTGLRWTVVESLPVSEDIKRQTGNWRAHVEAWKQSLRHLHAAGLRTICYNFMPLLDWTRTDLEHPLANGTTCLRFDADAFAVFDHIVLGRESDDAEAQDRARARHAQMTEAQVARLVECILWGLPGDGRMSLDELKEELVVYARLGEAQLRRHFADFLELVTPLAEDLGMRLCCHPDDPPFGLLGLPRVVSTDDDLDAILKAVDLPANGLTLCTGSLGARADNDLPGMIDRLGDRIHFLHLRNVRRDADRVGASFHESGHIDGDVDMAAVVSAVLAEEARRRDRGRADHSIPFRPDHGLATSADQARRGQPGYPLVGRHVGLGELNGLIASQSREPKNSA